MTGFILLIKSPNFRIWLTHKIKNLRPWLIKSWQSYFKLYSSDSNLVLSYLITAVFSEFSAVISSWIATLSPVWRISITLGKVLSTRGMFSTTGFSSFWHFRHFLLVQIKQALNRIDPRVITAIAIPSENWKQWVTHYRQGHLYS